MKIPLCRDGFSNTSPNGAVLCDVRGRPSFSSIRIVRHTVDRCAGYAAFRKTAFSNFKNYFRTPFTFDRNYLGFRRRFRTRSVFVGAFSFRRQYGGASRKVKRNALAFQRRVVIDFIIAIGERANRFGFYRNICRYIRTILFRYDSLL